MAQTMVWQYINGTSITLWISFWGLLIGFTGGTLLGVLSSKRVTNKITATLIRGYIYVVQGTPLLIQTFIVYLGLPLVSNVQISEIMAGILVLGFNSIAYLAQTIRGGVNALPAGQWEAGYMLGYTKLGTLRHIVLPQVIRTVLPSLTNEMISLIKETSIFGVIGVVELTKVSRDIVNRTLTPAPLFYGALLYLLITTSLQLIMRVLERRLDYDHRH